MKKIIALTFLFVYGFSANIHAETKTYIGLEWGGNDDWRPNLVIGYKDAEVTEDGEDLKVDGWGAAVSLGWDGLDRVKLYKITGNESLQFEPGIGYNASQSAPFVSAGIQANRLIADIDFVFDGDIKGHLGVSTFEKYSEVDKK